MSDYRWQIAPFENLSIDELYASLYLRQQVFVVEQKCIYQDLDGLDQSSIHILCWQHGELLASLRCLPPGLSYAESSLGRIVVSPSGRGRDLGRELVSKGIAYNLESWPDSGIRIGAQAYLQAFYESLGFIVDGDPYDEDGISHVHMNLRKH